MIMPAPTPANMYDTNEKLFLILQNTQAVEERQIKTSHSKKVRGVFKGSNFNKLQLQ